MILSKHFSFVGEGTWALVVIAIAISAAPYVLAQRPAGNSMMPAMDREMRSVYKPDRPGAAIIVVKNGRTIFRRGYGLANLELKVPVAPEMVFRLCSVTKQFTAAAIMLLAEQGKLSLSDDIANFFPDYPSRGKKITIENLLTHTSGINDYLGKVWPSHIGESFSPAGLIDLFKNEPLLFAPGTREDYSNSNYVLLGAIIEKLSGKSYGQFIDEQIFNPLGMKHSFYEHGQDLVPGRVSGYLTKDGVYINAAHLQMSQLYAAGGVDSTVDDLAIWDAAINAGKVLNKSSWEHIFTPFKLPGGEVSPYASGWVIGKLQGHSSESHAGGIPGFRAYVLRLPEDHVYVALLSNDETADTQPEIIANRLAAIAIGKPIVEPKTFTLPADALEKFTGEYQKDGDRMTVRRDGNRLFEQGAEDPEVELFPVSSTAFIVKAFDARLTFENDAGGSVTGVIVSFGGQEMRFAKIKRP